MAAWFLEIKVLSEDHKIHGEIFGPVAHLNLNRSINGPSKPLVKLSKIQPRSIIAFPWQREHKFNLGAKDDVVAPFILLHSEIIQLHPRTHPSHLNRSITVEERAYCSSPSTWNKSSLFHIRGSYHLWRRNYR